ncbi:hypothetical protein [Lysinibacillus boronitolerans]|nr:hypothetical protein [Lysinibacillus boronitolerans]
MDSHIQQHTHVGLVKGLLANDEEIEQSLQAKPMADFFAQLEQAVSDYYK